MHTMHFSAREALEEKMSASAAPATGGRTVTIASVVIVVVIAAFLLLFVWPGFLSAPTLPAVAFDVAKCDKFDTSTGYALDETKSKENKKCVYTASTPVAFDMTKCTKFDANTGNALDEVASKTAGKCTYEPKATSVPTAVTKPEAPSATKPTDTQVSKPSNTGGAVACMTDSDVMSLFGFAPGETVRTDAPWDACKWSRQNVPSIMQLVLREGWGLTYTDPQGNVWVTLGHGQNVTVRGFSLRQPGNQFLALGATGYLNKEWDFGFAPERGTRPYAHCPDSNIIDQVTLTADQKAKCAQQGTTPAVR